MNLKSFINNKYTLVGSIVFYLTGVYLTSRFATYLPCEGSPGILFPSAERWLSSPLSNHSVNSILILSGGILLLRINNLFSLIQKHTLLPFLFFLLLEVCSPQRKHNGCGSNDDFVFFFLGLSARKGTTGISNDGNHFPMYPVLSRICLLHTPVYHRIRANKVFHAEIPVRSIHRIRHPVLDIDRNRNHAFLRIVCIDSRFYVSYTRNTPL